jgi:hypothetical protein
LDGLDEPEEVGMSRKPLVCSIALAALAVLAAPGLAAGQAVESLWQSGPMTIDGVAKEWNESTPIIDEDSKVEYAFRNDDRNLYIIMVFKNPMYKSTLDYTGMKIYFATGTKKSKDYGILFQKKQMTAEALIASLQKRGQNPGAEQVAEIRKQPTHVIFSEEFIKPKKAAVPTDPPVDTDPPKFQAIDKGRISVCEFRIPLNLASQIGGINAGPGQQILLGFDWGGMNAQIMRDMMAGRADTSVSAGDRGVSSDSGFDSGGGGDDAGGNIRGMGSGVGEMNRDPRYKKHTFWVEAKLAAKG